MFDVSKMGKKRGEKTKVGKDPLSRKAKVNEHEHQIAAKLGGVRQPNSGGGKFHKGDIKLDAFLLDSKETSTNSIILTSKELMKIIREAWGEKKEPGLVVTIDKMPAGMPTEWAMIPLEVFAELLNAKKDS